MSSRPKQPKYARNKNILVIGGSGSGKTRFFVKPSLMQLPPCMPFPRALTGFPVSSTAKVMYCRMLDAMLSKGQEDENGILFVCFPVTAIAAVLSRSPMTVKRSLNELETAGLIMRVRQGVGEPNRIYVLIPGKEDAALA